MHRQALRIKPSPSGCEAITRFINSNFKKNELGCFFTKLILMKLSSNYSQGTIKRVAITSSA